MTSSRILASLLWTSPSTAFIVPQSVRAVQNLRLYLNVKDAKGYETSVEVPLHY